LHSWALAVYYNFFKTGNDFMLWPILILTGIGVACGALILVVNKVLPAEPASLKKAEEVNESLPGMNCGACGYPGCFAYAQALSKDKKVFFSSTCTTALQDETMLSGIEKALDLNVDKSSLNKKAVVECSGNCENVGVYTGVAACRTASKILRGFKKCPYSCLGLGDCIETCPQNAIHPDINTNIVVIDTEKCNGCGLCVKECPRNVIKLVPARSKIVFLCNYQDLRDIPGREKCDSGCKRCRKCVKVCPNEAVTWNKDKSIPEFDFEKCDNCRECIKACPQRILIELDEILK
jgi:electron transport complex protein RnfB